MFRVTRDSNVNLRLHDTSHHLTLCDFQRTTRYSFFIYQ